MPSLNTIGIATAGAWLLAMAAAAAGSPAGPLAPAADDQPPIDYRREIQPILEAKCLRCHNSKQKKGGLDMSTLEAMLQGGNSGPALVLGDSKDSLMIELIHFDEMPPAKEQPRVEKSELQKLRQWVDAGAPLAPSGSMEF